MLRRLSIQNMILIEALELDFQPGLNALTGETGAGKSILLECLGFALGWRGRAELVRAGADQGSVEAEFDLPFGHPARAVLEQAGLDAEDDVLLLRRVNSAEGRKTAWVNNQRCSGTVLREISPYLVELHGQQDDRGLLNPKGHLALLDSFAETGPLIAAVRAAWAAWHAARSQLSEAKEALQKSAADADYLRHALSEFEALNPEVGEDSTLADQRRLMQAAARIREDIARAHEALGADGAEGRLQDGLRWLEGVAEHAGGQLEAAISGLGRALSELADAQSSVEDALRATDFDPQELEQIEERLFALRGLARKHQVQPDDLPRLWQDFAARLDAIDNSAAHIGGLEAAEASAGAAYEVEAQKLSAARQEAASRLDMAVAAELEPLKMGRAVFETQITKATPGPSGFDDVAFCVATNPGAPSGPLNKIASGGELSRFLLALKVCLAGRADDLTMIFDEIDRGVGGATAYAVGRRLLRLGRGGQVLVVTHSPQVAALAQAHWRIEKQQGAGSTRTHVTPVSGDARIDEIARMLAGDTITDASREAARALMQD